MFHKAFENENKLDRFVPPIFNKPARDHDAIVDLFRSHFLTKSLEESQWVQLAKATFKIISKKGESIIRYGDTGNVYYILAQGQCQITVYQEGTDPQDPKLEDKVSRVKIIEADPEGRPPKPMVGFGEVALLYNDRRSASVRATADCSLWALNGNVFK